MPRFSNRETDDVSDFLTLLDSLELPERHRLVGLWRELDARGALRTGRPAGP